MVKMSGWISRLGEAAVWVDRLARFAAEDFLGDKVAIHGSRRR
jgi:hypothetical protein